MPRKTNGIEFELHPSPKRDEEGKPLLYARPASGRKKTMKQLDDFCAEYRNLQKGEMERLFNLFLDVAGNWLSQGYRVETPIGSLSIKLKLVGEHSDPDKVTGRDILYNGVEFTPSKELVEKAGKHHEGYPFVVLEVYSFFLSATTHEVERDDGDGDTYPLPQIEVFAHERECTDQHHHRTCSIDGSDDGDG
jgi:hypothetical protein